MGVVLSGLGVVSPLACSVDDLCRAAVEATVVGDADGLHCEIPLDAIPADRRARIGRLDRLCRLFLSASYLATHSTPGAIDAAAGERVGLVFGTGLGCVLTNAEYYERVVEQGPAAASPRLFAYTVSSAAAGEVSIALGITGPNVTQHMGFAAGLGAVGYGFDLIEMGKADAVLAGGGDANGPALAEGLRDMALLKDRAHARPFRDRVPGVWPSEGAVVAVLESTKRRRGAHGLGTIAGYAAGFEPTLASGAPSPRGVAETTRRALALSGVSAGDVDAVVTSAHGTPMDDAELAAIRDCFGARPLLVAPKAVCGETFAASPLLGLALVVGVGEPAPASRAGADRLPYLYAADGSDVDGADGLRRLRDARVVVVQALCYSGDVVALVFTRGEAP